MAKAATKASAAGVFGVGFALRLAQAEAKAARRPWDMAKGFDNSAVIGALHAGPLPDAAITCTVDGRITQSARLSDMIWPVPDIIAHLSTYVELKLSDIEKLFGRR